MKIARFFSLKNNYFVGSLIFLSALTTRLVYLQVIGIKVGSDTTFYVRAANVLRDAHFNLTALSDHGYAFFYWLYPLFLGLLQSDYLTVVVVQILLQSFGAVLVFTITARLLDRTTGILAGVGYALLWEAFQWDMYVLTDSLFFFLIVLTTFFALDMYQKQTLRSRILFAVCMFGMLLSRPTIFPFLAAVALLLFWNYPRTYKIAASVVGLILLAWASFAIFSDSPGPQFGLGPYLRYFASLFQEGILVRDRPALTLAVDWSGGLLSDLFTFSKIFIARLGLFWVPIIPEFSLGHKLLSLITMVPVVILAPIGAYHAMKEGSDQLKLRFFSFLLATILFFWVFQSLSEIDYDWRYRLPVLPFMVIFASYGFVFLWRKLSLSKGKLASSSR